MLDLKTIQTQFAANLNQEAAPTSIFKGALKLSALQSTAIYRSSFINAFKKVLSDTFPVCKKIVGEDFFQGMIHFYIESTASQSPNIDAYSQHFADFIREFSPAQSLPYLAEVAQLEWLLQCVSEGENYCNLDIQSLAALNDAQQEKIIFAMPKNSYLIKSTYPLHKIWKFNQDDYTGPETIDINNSPCFLLIWRPQNLPLIENIEATLWTVLDKTASQLTVAELCDYFSDTTEINFSNALSHCVERGWINHFRLSSSTP